MSHTKGPWTPMLGGSVVLSSARPTVHVVAMVEYYDNDEEFLATTRLIAAAPILLEALEGLLEYLGPDWIGGQSVRDYARAAIAAARKP